MLLRFANPNSHKYIENYIKMDNVFFCQKEILFNNNLNASTDNKIYLIFMFTLLDINANFSSHNKQIVD